MKFINQIYLVGSLSMGLVSCSKFVQVSPPTTEIVGATVYSTNSTAASAVTAIYLSMDGYNTAGGSVGGGTYGISALLGLSADEFTLYPTTDQILNPVYANNILSKTAVPMWGDLYNLIYQANSAIEGISSSSGVTASMKQQLIGESEVVRAFCNFYLVNIYGNVPNVVSTDYKVNETIGQSSPAQVYQQIVSDLLDSQGLLSDNFLAPDGSTTTERVRPNRGAATALLARVYLYEQKWDSAEAEATAVINNSNYILVTSLDSAFLSNNTEAIWQLEIPNNGFNTHDGSAFLLSDFGGPSSSYPFCLSDSLVYGFEPNDLRRITWVDSIVVNAATYYFPFKYELNYTGMPPQEYPVLFRLAEQYLIRAEARAQQSNLGGAADDLNVIRTRAGLPNTTAVSQQDLLDAIYRERRFELFTEYGHRWLDLIRSGNVNSLMGVVTPQKGGNWLTTDQLYPIPLTEIQGDPKLNQNPGYN
jgi:starch-binding outer membrane protein, SusD/RagB family